VTRKPKPCKWCSEPRQDWSASTLLNAYCGPGCAAKHAQHKRTEARLKAERKQRIEARERIKTRSDWQKEAQAAFNKWIRERDYGKPCISCGAMEQQRSHGSHFDCGHYRSTGAAPHMRFVAYNAAGQCVRCNRELSGNAVEMRKGMVWRFGLERVEQVEQDDTPRKYDVYDLKRIKRIFSRRARNYRKWRNA